MTFAPRRVLATLTVHRNGADVPLIAEGRVVSDGKDERVYGVRVWHAMPPHGHVMAGYLTDRELRIVEREMMADFGRQMAELATQPEHVIGMCHATGWSVREYETNIARACGEPNR